VSGDTGEPAAGDIWHPSTWGRVSPRLGKHHKGLKKKGGGRVDGFSCRYWPAPRMSPDTRSDGVTGTVVAAFQVVCLLWSVPCGHQRTVRWSETMGLARR